MNKKGFGEIGTKARLLDEQLTIIQRMKLDKKGIVQLIGALLGYFVAILLMASLL